MDQVQDSTDELLAKRAVSVACGNAQAIQQLLTAKHQQSTIVDVSDFSRQVRAAEAQWFSQNGEDGILLFLLARIMLQRGVPRLAAEVGAGNGWENNTINLAAHRGFDVLLFDPSWELEHVGVPAMQSYPSMVVNHPTVVHAFVEPANINGLFETARFDRELSVLSIDVDGNDFWLWRALLVADPLIVCVEVNVQLGGDVAWAMPYDRGYDYWTAGKQGYHGASVRAFDKLARHRGYVFAGTDHLNVNGFWVKHGLIPELGDGAEIDRIWDRPRTALSAQHFAVARREFEWVEVTDELVADVEATAVPFSPVMPALAQ